jgi:hypothetical protein
MHYLKNSLYYGLVPKELLPHPQPFSLPRRRVLEERVEVEDVIILKANSYKIISFFMVFHGFKRVFFHHT